MTGTDQQEQIDRLREIVGTMGHDPRTASELEQEKKNEQEAQEQWEAEQAKAQKAAADQAAAEAKAAQDAAEQQAKLDKQAAKA